MNHRQAFIRSICEHPQDDAPRLIFADYLEENGEEDYAEFIRLQIELEKMRAESMKEMKRKGQHAGMPCRHIWPEVCGYCRDLIAREKALIEFPTPRFWMRPAKVSLLEWTWQRGLVIAVSCTAETWLKHGPEIVQQQPIEELRLPDRKPLKVSLGENSMCWFNIDGEPWNRLRANADFMPAQWADPRQSVHYFDTEETANRWLTVTALKWARKKAGLE